MDSCFAQLNSHLREYFLAAEKSSKKSRFLIWLDENYEENDLDPKGLENSLTIATNRFDTAQSLEKQALNTVLCDFNLPSDTSKFSAIFFRVSKERLVSHRCINQSAKLLKKKGSIFLFGRKDDGIKTYFNKCIKDLDLQGELKKHKDCYVATLNRNTDEKGKNSTDDATKQLDDGNYKNIRKVTSIKLLGKPYAIYSKPGVYGWKKADTGTSYLIDELSSKITKPKSSESALDLGCGSGHLSLFAAALGYKNISATDNNIAAVAATKRTLKENSIKAKVTLSDAGNSLDSSFDLILCNPPFHKGFSTDSALTQKFILSCRRLLASNGVAYFVTNSFIAIEKELFKAGLNGSQLANNSRFKVLKISRR